MKAKVQRDRIVEELRAAGGPAALELADDLASGVIEKDSTYNGWKNYETWSVALIVDNDEGLYNERREIVCEAIERSRDEKPEYFTQEEATRFFVADTIKEWIMDAQPDFDEQSQGPLCYLWSQLLMAALSEVDWFEIADHWIEDEVEVSV